jgi:hypothetical protein
MTKKQLKGLIIMLVAFFFLTPLALCSDDKTIHTSRGKYEDYYHIRFTLTPDNTLLELKGYDKYGPSKYEFSDGQFEIFVTKDKFPIPAPKCSGYIILRMSMTLDDVANKEKYIAEKKSLFDRIKKMKETKSGNIDVVIELNPYIMVKSKEPLIIELTECNVFFRNAGGRYINYVGQLQSKEAVSDNAKKP